MLYEKLIIASTTSGRDLGKKVCKALDDVISREFANLNVTERWQIENWDVLKQNRFDSLTIIKAFNKQEFGDGRFHLWPMNRVDFASTEFKIVINKSVRGADVFLIHNSFEPNTPVNNIFKAVLRIVRNATDFNTNRDAHARLISMLNTWRAERTVAENDMELLYTISAMKKDAGAKRVVTFNPMLSNQRQDHRRKREGINVRDFIELVAEAGSDELLTFDIHSIGTLACSGNIKLDNIYPTDDLINAFKTRFPNYKEKFVIIAPDAGAAKKCEYFAKKLELPVFIASKTRDYNDINKVDRILLPYQREDLENKIGLVIDDMVDTAGTLFKVHGACMEKGMAGIVVITTHFLANYNKEKRIDPIEVFDKMYKKKELLAVFSTDTVTRPKDFSRRHKWYHEVSIAPRIAHTIFRMHFHESVEKAHLDE